MECGGCNLIDEHPVTLNGGTVVCNECPAWRLECEARDVLSRFPGKESLAARRAYLSDVAKRRGTVAADELKAAMTVEWEKKKAA